MPSVPEFCYPFRDRDAPPKSKGYVKYDEPDTPDST